MSDDTTLEDRIDIDAPPGRIWALVGDPTRLAAWSPQVMSSRWKEPEDGTAAGPGLGRRFTNRNRDGELEWSTHGEVVAYEAPRRVAFRIEENSVVWTFELTPTPGGTLLTQRRTAPDGISELSLELTEAFMGGQEVFTRSLQSGMRLTLEAIKAAAER